MRNLEHPGILKLYEVFENEDAIYLVLEYIKGYSLENKIKNRYNNNKRFSLAEIEQILVGIL